MKQKTKKKKTIPVICVAVVLTAAAALGNSGEEAENISDGTTAGIESKTEYSSETEAETLPKIENEEQTEKSEIPESSLISNETDPETDITETEEAANVPVDGIRPEIKDALDSYEAFFVEYCDFMKKLNESPDDFTLLGEYAEYSAQYFETMDKIDQMDDSEMIDEELKYYLKVTNRINEMLIDVSL